LITAKGECYIEAVTGWAIWAAVEECAQIGMRVADLIFAVHQARLEECSSKYIGVIRWKSVARAEALGKNTKICALCGGPLKEAKRSEDSGNQGGTREKRP
jgi:hypothetical protein